MIQTVATLPAWRNKGLIRKLFHCVDHELAANKDQLCLLANKNLTAFYQQFGFEAINLMSHFQSSIPLVDLKPIVPVKINLKNYALKARLFKKLEQRAPISDVFGEIEKNWLFKWYCDQVYHSDVYYIQDLDAYVLYRINDFCLTLFDIVADKIPTIEEVYPYIGAEKITTINYMFTPDKVAPEANAIMDDNDHLFVRGGFEIPKHKFTVPMLSRG